MILEREQHEDRPARARPAAPSARTRPTARCCRRRAGCAARRTGRWRPAARAARCASARWRRCDARPTAESVPPTTVMRDADADEERRRGASPIRSVRMAMATGSGSDVRWRNSQPPSRVRVWSGVGSATDSGQFDRVREVDKIRTSSVGYRHDPQLTPHRVLNRAPGLVRPRHDRADAARPPAPVRAREPRASSSTRKAEWQNPGGSVKDRAAARMILEGEASGKLTPGQDRSSTRRRATPASPTRWSAPRAATR